MKTKLVKVNEVEIKSLIKKNFSNEFMKKIYDVYSDDYMSIVEKTKLFDKLFTEEFGDRKDYRRIGEGTNRFVCLLDNHIIKVAYNYLAYIDNMNELAQAKYKQKYLAHAYETNGIILVSEYVTVMSAEEFLECQSEIGQILLKLEKDFYNEDARDKNKYYILGDMGMSNKNYGNWGRRMNGDIVILDYGYLYQLSENEWKETAKCPTCGSSLKYTKDYSELECTKTGCHVKVKYTTLRNNFGYANIIKNIKENLVNDRYVKFDKNGSIKVDVMEKVIDEDEVIEEFKMPEDIENKINNARQRFYEIADFIRNNYELTIDDITLMEDEIFNEENEYDEKLFPYILASLNLTYRNVDVYLKEFDKIADARYNELYEKLEEEFNERIDKEKLAKMEAEDNQPDYYDPEEEYTVRGYESNIKFVDLYEDEEHRVSELDMLLSSEIDPLFSNLVMMDEKNGLDDVDENNDMTLDTMLRLADITKQYNTEEVDEPETVDEGLEHAYNKLEEALIDLIKTIYITKGKYEESEEDYVAGDVDSPLLNGDVIDTDYSPTVNAKNMLVGWEPDKFAFPLYRHLLNRYDYDTDKVDYEFKAIYNINGDIDIPEDLYSNTINRGIVIDQILTRFDEDIKPARYRVINSIGQELTDYYKALDKYYESLNETDETIEMDDPDYYLNAHANQDNIKREMREAKMNLKDEMLDQGYRLEGFLNDHRLVYYYDVEALMNETELEMLDVIKMFSFDIESDIVNDLLNKFYMIYDRVIDYSVLDIFKYKESYIREEGAIKHPRHIKPQLKAKLVEKESDEDGYKPVLFNLNKLNKITIEQRYELTYNILDDMSKIEEMKSNMKRKGLYFREELINKYSVRKTRENMRYGLTDNEIEIVGEYEEMLSNVSVKDKDNLFKQSIFRVLDRRHNFSYLTREFMKNLIETDLSTAYGLRLLKINVLEMSGTMSRLNFLQQVDC